MPYLRFVLCFTFLQSVACVLLQRGVFFFTHDRLGFSEWANLWLAAAGGLAYVVGALPSHRVARVLGERRAMIGIVTLQMAAVAGLRWVSDPYLLTGLFVVFSLLNAMAWPIAESYAAAGRSPAEASRSVGFFNMAWGTAVPVAVLMAGSIIAATGPGLFLVSVALSGLSIIAALWLPARPPHHPDDHPDRPDARSLARLRALTSASRWSMVGSYALLSVLASIMPNRLADLGLSVAAATALFCCLDASRAVTFVVMQRTTGWHHRRAVLLAGVLLLPIGFVLTARADGPAMAIGGEIVFGVAAGVIYYAALYYAMVASNAAVESGGAHEALIGSGFAVGPVLAGLGKYIAPVVGGAGLGVMIGVSPLVLGLSIGALWQLARAGPRASGPGAGAPGRPADPGAGRST